MTPELQASINRIYRRNILWIVVDSILILGGMVLLYIAF